MVDTKVKKGRYRAKINGEWFYVYATNVQNAKRLFKKKGWIGGRWACNDLQVENSDIKDKYERISHGFTL